MRSPDWANGRFPKFLHFASRNSTLTTQCILLLYPRRDSTTCLASIISSSPKDIPYVDKLKLPVMSQHEAHKSKKRKHAATAVTPDTASAEPSIKRPKKEKEGDKGKDTKQGARADKGDGKVKAAAKSKSKGKGKGRATGGAFRVVRASLTVSVPPVFAMNLRGGVEELLDSMLMRCVLRAALCRGIQNS